MVMPETIDYLKSEIERLEALPKAALIRENLERLKKTVHEAEASIETKDFYKRLNKPKLHNRPRKPGRKRREQHG